MTISEDLFVDRSVEALHPIKPKWGLLGAPALRYPKATAGLASRYRRLKSQGLKPSLIRRPFTRP